MIFQSLSLLHIPKSSIFSIFLRFLFSHSNIGAINIWYPFSGPFLTYLTTHMYLIFPKYEAWSRWSKGKIWKLGKNLPYILLLVANVANSIMQYFLMNNRHQKSPFKNCFKTSLQTLLWNKLPYTSQFRIRCSLIIDVTMSVCRLRNNTDFNKTKGTLVHDAA